MDSPISSQIPGMGVGQFYQQPEQWSERAWLNIAAAGPFSSDRTVKEYARDIWSLASVEVPRESTGLWSEGTQVF